MAILISPMIVPVIISAVGMFKFYAQLGLAGTRWASSSRTRRWPRPSSSSR
jgi:ABC-type spermidine/putrescine transport system permease subunit II